MIIYDDSGQTQHYDIKYISITKNNWPLAAVQDNRFASVTSL